MLKNDYIMRAVEQLAQIVAHVLGLTQTGQTEEAKQELDAFASEYFGVPVDTLASLDDATLEHIIGTGPLAAVRAALCARLLWEHAALKQEPARLQRKSAALFSRAAALELDSLAPHKPVVAALLEDSQGLSSRLHMWLHAGLGNYARAEDALYSAMEEAPEATRPEAMHLYRLLLARDDEELERGDLPRDEVEAGLARLRA